MSSDRYKKKPVTGEKKPTIEYIIFSVNQKHVICARYTGYTKKNSSEIFKFGNGPLPNRNGQSVYWKVRPCPVHYKSSKNVSVFFVSKSITFV
jgi:hypothetical protein